MTTEIVERNEPQEAVIDLHSGDHQDRFRARIAREEAELVELERLRDGQPNEPTEGGDTTTPVAAAEPEPATVEEATYRKRYGDLRRHSQKIERENAARIKALEDQLSVGVQPNQMPATEQELLDWMHEYPDMARMIETIAIQKVNGVSDQLNAYKEQLETTKTEAARERAIIQIRKSHSDFDDLVQDQEFHDWVADQPDYIANALYHNATDAKAVIRAIDLYKADKGLNTKPVTTRQTERNASQTVRHAGTAAITETKKGLIKESEIHAMNYREYAARETEIDKAIKEGRVEWDISGGARL